METQTVSFNIDFLKESASNIALSHSETTKGKGKQAKPIKPILAGARDTLVNAYRVLSGFARAEKELSPAAEWLIDNFYIIQEQIVQTENDFPIQFQRSVPLIAGGELSGLPRVYELLLHYLTYTDNHTDYQSLVQYVQSYQETETLEQGEIWAIPIMIRLILIQKLAEKSTRILQRKETRKEIETLVSDLAEMTDREPGVAVNRISKAFQHREKSSGTAFYLVELHNQLQSSGLLFDEEKRWFNYRFRQVDMQLEEAMRVEAQIESRLQVSVQNAVISLRESSEIDWSDFVEECSVVEKILRLDPAGFYPEMDFKTRDQYRRTVERLSRRSPKTESEVAELVLKMVEEQAQRLNGTDDTRLHNNDVVKSHVGYFLAGEGYTGLADRVGYSIPVRERIQRMLENHTGWYIFAVILHTAILMTILWWASGAMNLAIIPGTAVLLVALFPALDLSVSAVNRFFAFFLPPRILPKMEFDDGIPDSARTIVVVPTLFSSPEAVRKQMEELEIRSLANPDPTLQFALLSDFLDADEKDKEGDTDILKTAEEMVLALNGKYRSRYGQKFFILHRERHWNPSENRWMGWERKRGKLEEFNRLILEPGRETSYAYVFGNFSDTLKKADIQFVITLDSDTRLPPSSAIDLVRTLSHPLNRPWYNPEKARVTKGYGIIQPRISIPAESSRKTWFTRIFSGNVGLDPYSTAVSDIYQDLAGEAIYTGKGIYDLRAFHHVLDDRFPENRILSHDLIESTYLRAGLATDIELFDDYPSTYSAYSKRSHRWVRGDWQIAAWLFRKVPEEGGKGANPINLLSKWKIFDNLRRSLNPFFLTVFFIAGWFLMPGSPWIWTAAAFGILAFPIYVSLSSDIINRPARVRWKLYMEKVRDNVSVNSIQSVFTVITLPHLAITHLDAIFRTLYRLMISREHLLEWTSASQTESSSPNSLGAYVWDMKTSVVLAAGILIASAVTAPDTLWIVLPFAILWGGAPFHLWLIGRSLNGDEKQLREEDIRRLRLYSRKTWFYFERFINEENNWLPPDNYQEEPSIPIANRTSPTNIGLALVSTQVAANRGYITFSERLDRLLNTLRTMDELDRFNGHFYNWYNTSIGETLHPKYISTVDSGNLAASLIAVKQAALQSMTSPDIAAHMWDGLTDTVRAVENIFSEYKDEECLPGDCYNRILSHCSNMRDLIDSEMPGSALNTSDRLKELKAEAARLCSVNLMPLGSKLDDTMMQNLLFWIDSPLRMIENRRNEHDLLNSLKQVDPAGYSANELINMLESDHSDSTLYKRLQTWKRQTDEIVYLCDKFVDEMDFSFLYLEKRGLFSIGYNVDKAILDTGTYDLLASEARISSYIAIAKGDVPVEHWFRLSRRLTSLNRNEILLSWGGTMFEYLMPGIFMRSYRETLLSHTSTYVVEWQGKYGASRNKPWGFSESAYGFLNLDMHYQYRAFGAPGLGLKRGLAEEYVVAPYASMLSLMISPKDSLDNLKKLEMMGGAGSMGFYDAIDFTPRHLREGESFRVVKTYMVHHQGMSLLAIENVLNDLCIQNYFHADPRIRGCELILQERIPRGVPIKEPHPIDAELEPGEQKSAVQKVEHAGIGHLDCSPPRLHLLGNGTYSTFLTHAGTGASSCDQTMMYRWEPDLTTDPCGFFFYIKDVDSGNFWSSMHQPVRRKPDRYDTWFHNGKVITSRVDDWIETTTEVTVSPDHKMELRRLTLTNYSQNERHLEVTSYAEVVLNGYKDHISHPAFSKLFIQTDFLNEHHSIIVKRRPRSADEKPLWMVHTFAGPEQGVLSEPLQYETERSRFIGRGRTLENPAAMDDGARLQSSLGNVSDPIVSMRKKVVLDAGSKAVFTFGIGLAETREQAEQLADIYDNPYAVERTFNLTAIYSSVELDHIGISSAQAHLYQKMASWLIYPEKRFRADEETICQNRRTQQNLWAYGISGDLPLVILRIDKTSQLKHVRSLLQAHKFWRLKGLETELLFINDHGPSYVDEINEAILNAVEASAMQDLMNQKGGIFIQRSDKMTEDDLTLLLSVAHLIFERKLPHFSDFPGRTLDTGSWREEHDRNLKTATEKEPAKNKSESDAIKDSGELQFYNGYGGFSSSGEEYHIHIPEDPTTGLPLLPPAPWTNVIANSDYGTLITERGSGYTWSKNSRENKLTGWSNDPVTDPASEAVYIRDDKTGQFWSATPGPAPGKGTYKVTHGFGYSRFEHTSQAIRQQMTQYVANDSSDKITAITLRNETGSARRLSVYRYVERVLGVSRYETNRYIIQTVSGDGLTLFAQNYYNNEFAGRTAYVSAITCPEKSKVTYTTDRSAFIGRNCSLCSPKQVVTGGVLQNRVGIMSDPCVVFRIEMELNAGEEVTLEFLEGEAVSKKEAIDHIEKIRRNGMGDKALQDLKKTWKQRLSRIQIKTPDKSMDMLVNGWLMYQNLSSRMWGRTAFYQSGGAFGFRDQLQDAMAACYSDPSLVRKQILLHAAHQFKKGDVLHWWHPPTGRGIRSKISDDRLWLPYVTDFYIRATGDDQILDEEVSYITARELEEYEHEVYLHPKKSSESETLYQHCCRAIDVSLEFGVHGLPLIGAGDWNDGMNRVGEQGKGESVWLGFFMYDILNRFVSICTGRDDLEKAADYKNHASNLKHHLNSEGWDGEWFLRAFYDDGSPLGSSTNSECQIDAISQAWSVLSGAADQEKGELALASAERLLIAHDQQLIRLLWPPFNQTEKDPGYIKGYIPGVRENGGQYTHGALWLVKAFAELGHGNKAVTYFNLINPVNHSLNRNEADRYKVEPYVAAADVYGEPPLSGMGGWSWYTGSGGWMYRVALESILGFRLTHEGFKIKPAISGDWPGFEIIYKPDDIGTEYKITVGNPDGLEKGKLSGTIDGEELQTLSEQVEVRVLRDGKRHRVDVSLVASASGVEAEQQNR